VSAKGSDKLSNAVATASEQYDADIFFYSGEINDGAFGSLAGEIAKVKCRPNSVLILVTHGGQANPGYQIARLFQKTYTQFILYAPSFCKSAGTIIALGANRLLMDAFSELGPLDVQLLKQNEIMARKSGLLSRSSFQALAGNAFELYEFFMLRITMASSGRVSFKLASELSATMASNLLSPVYGQINPEIVGSDFRDLSVAEEYGERLVAASGNADAETVSRLIHNYPAHDFIIDENEARTLFQNVDPPTEPLYEIISCLGEAAFNEQSPPVAIALSPERARTAKPKEDEDAELPASNEAGAPLDGGGSGNQQGDSSQTGPNGQNGGVTTSVAEAQSGGNGQTPAA
jgi:hypothetical protein